MHKKAQGLTFNTLAIAAIVLIVVIVSIAIFTGVLNDVVPFFKTSTQCEKQGGSPAPTCVASGQCKNGVEIYGLGCEDKKGNIPFCCIKT